MILQQKSKEEYVAYLGLLQPLSIPDQVWRHISVDFIEGLLKSKVDVANKFWKRVHTLLGTPESIVSDRD